MKLFKHSLMALMLLTYFSCGGSKGGGSSSSSSSSSSSNVVASGSTAETNFKTWAAGTETLSLSSYQINRAVQSMSSCTTKKFLGISYQYCTAGNTSTTLERSYVSSMSGAVRSSYSSIANIVTPPAGYSLVQINQTGNYYDIYHVETSSNKLVHYIIDTSLHAAKNPLIEENAVTSTKKQFYSNTVM